MSETAGLLCIGGPWDSKWTPISPGQRDLVVHRAANDEPISYAPFDESLPVAMSTVTVSTHYYRRESLFFQGSHGLDFFIHQDLTFMEAIEKLMKGYRP